MNYNFYVKVLPDGAKFPLIEIEPESLDMLQHLSRGHLSSSEEVKKELSKIDAVMNGETEKYSFGGDDWCILEVHQERTKIINGFDEFEPFEIDTNDIISLLKDWLLFLIKYENNEIPSEDFR